MEKITAIRLTTPEVQSGSSRVKWAEGLIKQLPENHDGRNSWLLNYGSDSKVVHVYPDLPLNLDVPDDILAPSIKGGEVVRATIPGGQVSSKDSFAGISIKETFIPDNVVINTAKIPTFEEALSAELNEKDCIQRECMDHPLYPVFMAAITQAMYGKGERHGGAKTPFFDQPWVHYQRMHGRGFLTGQSSKKLEEAAHQREGKPFIDEVLGAIVYAGMAVLREQGDVK